MLYMHEKPLFVVEAQFNSWKDNTRSRDLETLGEGMRCYSQELFHVDIFAALPKSLPSI